jgi:hypothetical protein
LTYEYTEIASLNRPRQAHSSLICDHRQNLDDSGSFVVKTYLYVIGGYNNKTFSNYQCIERLDLSSNDSKWELIKVKNQSPGILATNCLVLEPFVKSTKNELILLGGRIGMSESYQDSAFSLIIEDSVDSGPVATMSNICNYYTYTSDLYHFHSLII